MSSKQTSSWYAMTATDLFTHVGIIAGAMLLIVPGLIRRGEVGGIGTTICLVGASGTVILALLAFGFAYWHPWYDFGTELTHLVPHHFPSLFAGAALYTMDGLVLTIGYYVLFQKHSLVNAILYICLYISSIYCFTFPAYARIGM